MTRILGIDPGSRVTGYGLIDAVGGKLDYVVCGCLRGDSGSLPQRLKGIYRGLDEVIREHLPGEAAIEDIFMSRNVASALKLGQARGVAMAACLSHNLPVEEYSARKVKQALAGRGSAAKPQIQHMVKALLGIADSIAEDAADALAVAICHAHTQAGLVRLADARSFSRQRLRG